MKLLARRALDQSNGALFLNRKLIVQLSTSRFRPQPKEMTPTTISPPPKQLMMMNSPPSSSSSSSIIYQRSPGGSNPLPPQFNYEMLTSTNLRQSSPISDTHNYFRPPSPLSDYYSNLSIVKSNHMKLNKTLKTGISNRMD